MSDIKGKQVFNNAKWIIACKIIQSLLQLIVGMLCARYLGPSNYGLINYAASIMAFALPIMKLGLDSTMVYELTENPEKEGEILGTSLVMNVFSSIVCFGGIYLFVSAFNGDEKITVAVCLIYSISLFFAAIEMVQYWFQYKLLSKYSSIVMLCAYVIVSAYRIYLLVSHKSVYWFAVTNSIDFGLIGLSLLLIYFRMSSFRLSFSFKRAKKMFSKSKHYIFSSLMTVVIHNTDHIMLTTMVGKEENGFYTAAITCATVAQFVYTAIIDSYRPLILSCKKSDEAQYRKNVSGLYCIIIYLAFAQSIVFTVFAKLIVGVLYGEEYMMSAKILQFLIWYLAFSVMGTVRNVWILAEQKQKYLWIINLSGALINVVLNAFLIPEFGAIGAALASFVTQFTINFVLGFILKPIRENNRLLLKGLNPEFAVKEFKNIVNMLIKPKEN